MTKKGSSTTSVLRQAAYHLSTHFCLVSYRVKPECDWPPFSGRDTALPL